MAVFGHIDEIGFVVNHVDDEGYAWFSGVGGWDPAVLVGQRVRILGRDGTTAGVIGKKARHLQDADERAKPVKIDELWIDVGAGDAEEAANRVHVGDLGVLEQPILELPGDRLVSRACDNRCGAFVAAEAVRLYAADPGVAKLTGVASVSEETSFLGAHTTGHALAPAAAIAVDVTHTTDHPTTSKQKGGGSSSAPGRRWPVARRSTRCSSSWPSRRPRRRASPTRSSLRPAAREPTPTPSLRQATACRRS